MRRLIAAHGAEMALPTLRTILPQVGFDLRQVAKSISIFRSYQCYSAAARLVKCDSPRASSGRPSCLPEAVLSPYRHARDGCMLERRSKK